MPDIVDLLQTTARSASSAPDLDQVEQRAHQLRVRQQAAWVAAVAAVVLAVPLALSLPGKPDALEQQPATRPTAGPTNAATAQPPLLGGAAPSTDASTPGSPTSRPTTEPVGSAAPRATSSASAGTPAGPSTSTAAPAASCHVSTTTLLPNQSDSCTFRATGSGGWKMVRNSGAGVIAAEDAVVTVQRDGATRRYTNGDNLDRHTGCGNDIIQPGDVVTVTVRQSARGYQNFDLGAGVGYGC